MSEHRPLEMPHLRAWQRWYDTRIQGAGLVMHAIPCVSEGEDIGFLAIIVDHPTKGLIYYRLESGFLSYHSDIDDWENPTDYECECLGCCFMFMAKSWVDWVAGSSEWQYEIWGRAKKVPQSWVDVNFIKWDSNFPFDLDEI